MQLVLLCAHETLMGTKIRDRGILDLGGAGDILLLTALDVRDAWLMAEKGCLGGSLSL